jgi:hypothetical protein
VNDAHRFHHDFAPFKVFCAAGSAKQKNQQKKNQQNWTSRTRALFTIKNEFSLAKSCQNDVEARNDGLVQERSPTVRLNANTLFNGANKSARPNIVQNSHATPAPAAISYGCRVDGARRVLLPPRVRRARAVRFFENPEFTAFVCINGGAFHPTAPSGRSGSKATAATAGAQIAFAIPQHKSRSRVRMLRWTNTHPLFNSDDQHEDFNRESGCEFSSPFYRDVGVHSAEKRQRRTRPVADNPSIRMENNMRRMMVILASAMLAGSLLAAGAQARGGGGGGGGGHGGGGMGGGFGGGHVGGFSGGHVGGFGGAHMGGLGGGRIGGLGGAHVDGFRAGSMARADHDHFGRGRHRFVGIYDDGYCPYYLSNTWPYTCTY